MDILCIFLEQKFLITTQKFARGLTYIATCNVCKVYSIHTYAYVTGDLKSLSPRFLVKNTEPEIEEISKQVYCKWYHEQFVVKEKKKYLPYLTDLNAYYSTWCVFLFLYRLHFFCVVCVVNILVILSVCLEQKGALT